MSLPVGTLVMFVRSVYYADRIGQIGEIVSALHVARTYNSRAKEYRTQAGYDVLFRDGVWHIAPYQIVPITPPGTPDDVTRDEPIKEAA